jgi:hypothetical protein
LHLKETIQAHGGLRGKVCKISEHSLFWRLSSEELGTFVSSCSMHILYLSQIF